MIEGCTDSATRQRRLPALVVVMAKEPVPGRVKTRLSPPLSPDAAARCYEAFVADTLRRFGAVVEGLADCELAVDSGGSNAGARLAALARTAGGWRCVEQGSGDLGVRMRERLREGVSRGSAVVLVGSDSPDLPADLIPKAFLALEKTDVVLGPASDGGYYLIGCRGRVPDVFGHGIRWGGPDVFSDTLARVARTGATATVLAPWHDVDDWSGLVALAERLRRAGGAKAAFAPQATIGVLADLVRQGFSL